MTETQAQGDPPRRHWRKPPAHLQPLTLAEWNALKRGAGHCRRCGARDELDKWGQWHPPQHANTCAGNRAFHAPPPDPIVASSGLRTVPDLARPRRAFGERDDD